MAVRLTQVPWVESSRRMIRCFVLRCITVISLIAMAGCATGPNANARDPLEPLNRSVYQFNDALDRAVIKPVASTYRDVLPSPVRTGIGNFFNNVQDVWSAVNNALQLKGEAAGNSLVRFGVNSFLGLGGLLDVATEMQIERQTKDFGHTLGHWGVGAGPYLVLPLLGPSTARDTLALSVDGQGNLVSRASHVPTRNSLTGLNLLDKRAQYLQSTDMLDQVALDPYAFVRDAYLQRRRSSIYDGSPPDEDEPTPASDQKSAQ